MAVTSKQRRSRDVLLGVGVSPRRARKNAPSRGAAPFTATANWVEAPRFSVVNRSENWVGSARQGATSRVAEKLDVGTVVVSGHGFSHAVNC